MLKGYARYEAVLGVFHHVHLKIRLVSRPVRAQGALMHRLLAALVRHMPPEILHLVITTIAVVAGEATLATTPPPILRRLSHVIAHLHVTCNHEEHFINTGSSYWSSSSSYFDGEKKKAFHYTPAMCVPLNRIYKRYNLADKIHLSSV